MLKQFYFTVIHFLYTILNQIRERSQVSRLIRLDLNVFRANSGNWAIYKKLSLQSANTFPLQLCKLGGVGVLPDFFSLKPNLSRANDIEKLVDLFSQFGSDKGTHNYSPVYWHFLNSLPTNSTIIEIGVGTNKPGKISSMGVFGHPCASLQVWHALLPNSAIYGCDIDIDFDYDHKEFKLIQLDQLNLTHWERLFEKFGPESVDLLIDDGLHTTEANINSLTFAIRSLKKGGSFIVEDVRDDTLVVWRYVASMNACSEFEFSRFRGKTNNLVIVTRRI